MAVVQKSARVFRPAVRRRLPEEVAAQIRDAILDGHFQAGEKLPPERELAVRFGVNRTSIREAIKVLEGLGLVSVRQGDGVTVQPLVDASLDLLGPMIFRGGRVDHTLLEEFQEVLAVLLYGMARAAVARIRAEHIAQIRTLRDQIADATRAREDRFAAGRDLLVLIADITGNRVWQMVARRARDFLSSPLLRAAREQLRRDPARLLPMIDACLEALEAQRPREAVSRLRQALRILGSEHSEFEDAELVEQTLIKVGGSNGNAL
jgi:GntR family transcriptional repressor for pyruvate dehydrogenase complex